MVAGIDSALLRPPSAPLGRHDGFAIVVMRWRDGLIDGGEGVNPAVLREVVVIEADAGAENGMLRCAGSVGKTEARRESFAVVVRNAVDQRDIAGLQG